MRRTTAATAALLISGALVILGARSGGASGPAGYYGIIERVVFEPTEKDAERVQVWGAFAYADLGSPIGVGMSGAERGYLYFRVRSAVEGITSPQQIELNRREWADLKSVAGTGQAVAFGRWGYIGEFSELDPRINDGRQGYLYEIKIGRTDLRVRPSSEPLANPATYQTQTGVVKLSESGNHAAIIAKLREALKRK